MSLEDLEYYCSLDGEYQNATSRNSPTMTAFFSNLIGQWLFEHREEIMSALLAKRRREREARGEQ